MLRRLITSLGADYGQWRALLRAYMMLDFAVLRGAYGVAEMNRALTGLAFLCAFFTAMSLEPAVLIWKTSDLFTAATITVTFMAAMTFLMIVPAIPMLIASTDYAIIGFRPVSSRTYVVVRTTALLIYAAETAFLSGYLPVLAFFTRSDGSVALAGGAIVAIIATTFATTVAIVVTYGWLLQRLGAVRMRRIISYGLVIVTFAIIGGLGAGWHYFIDFGDLGVRFSVRDVALPHSAAVLAYPGAWFAAYVQIAHGVFGSFEAVAIAESLLLLAILIVLIRGRISGDYLARAAELAMDSTAPSARPDPAWAMLRGERRAVTVLLRHQIRADTQLQAGMIMAVVIAFMFIGMNVYSEGPSTDPFGSSSRSWSSTGFLAILGLAMMPSSMWQSMTRVMTPRAAWPFFTTGADRARIITGARDVIALYALAPTMLVSLGVNVWAFGHIGHALLFTILIAVFAYIELQLTVWADPALPFSRPSMPTSSGGLPFRSSNFLVAMLAMLLWMLVSLVAFRGPVGFLIAVAGLVGVSWGLSRATHRRILKRQRTMEYFE